MEQEKQLETAVLQEQKRRKRRKIISVLITILFTLFLLLAALAGIVAVMRAVGGRSLRNKTVGARPELMQEVSAQNKTDLEETREAKQPVWEEGWVRYEDKIYEYNEDILTFLVLGIDKEGTVKESRDAVSGGQADALFLVVMNPEKKDISIIAVNRDTMTNIQMAGYREDGYVQTVKAQIAVQHGFGGGMEESCELTKAAMSNLFYGLPIHGYISLNMGAVAKLNDALGGIEVTLTEDLTKVNSKWKEGETVLLKGKNAYTFVRWRDTGAFESNRARLNRQKQYLSAFVQKAKKAVQEDITIPLTLYEEFSKYIVTDVTPDETVYLAGKLLDYRFSNNAIYTLEGTTRMGEKYEEFYPDEEALKDLMIRVFYKEVEQN